MSAQFFSLTPDRVLSAVERAGVRCTGLCRAMNSLENRVYDVELEDGARVVAKFYRPGRWSRETILEEHGFLRELAEAEIPVCAPRAFSPGETLSVAEGTGIFVALFPKVGGRAPEEFSDAQLERLGMLLARMHMVGASRPAHHRRALTPETYGAESLAALESLGVIPSELRAGFRAVVESLLTAITPLFEDVPTLRVHGDCHPGNLLWGRDGGFFLDFDDMVTAPAVQDVWMLVPGRDAEAQRQRSVLLDAYAQMRPFDRSSLSLIEPLRALRYLHYAAWIARRWSDPSFPATFPQFAERGYWVELTQDLQTQCELIGASPVGTSLSVSVPARAPATSVREITYADDEFQRVVFVRSEVFLEELGADDRWDADGRDADATHLLALSPDGLAVGAARLLTLESGGPLKLSRLGVLYEHRRRAVGRALVERAVEIARERSASGLVVDARVESIPFFAALDFVAASKAFSLGGMTVRTMVRGW